MSELLLDSSETRPARTVTAGPVPRSASRPILIGAACAVVLAGFGVAASTVMADLIVPAKSNHRAAIGTGAAANWPDLKDGLPALAGTPVKVTTTKTDTAPAAPPSRMAALPNPMDYAGAPAAPQAAVVPPRPEAQRRAAEAPTARIPVPTQVSVLSPPSEAKPVPPGRTVTALAPRPSEFVRARDETPPVAEAAPRPEAPRIREAAVEKPAAKPAPVAAAKPAPVAAVKPAPAKPAPVAKATPIPEKAAKSVAVHKPTAPAQTPVRTAAAEPEPEDTEILGVKIPSLAPAGRKIKDSVSALGDAVRNAF
jgi:hypothetical protein